MKRWNIEEMMVIGRKLFAKIHKQKQHYQEVMEWFLKICWDKAVAVIARRLAQQANITRPQALINCHILQVRWIEFISKLGNIDGSHCT